LWLDCDERVEADDGYIGDGPYKIKHLESVTNPDEKMSYASICLQQTGDNQHGFETVGDFKAGIPP
jgi:hypothetical protein